MHVHALIWTDLSSEYLDKYKIMTPDLQQVLDSIICSELPEQIYIEGDKRRANKIQAPKFGLQKCPTPLDKPDQISFETRHHLVAESHRHLRPHRTTCRKGLGGKIGCRMGMPRALCPTTRTLQLDFEEEDIIEVQFPTDFPNFSPQDPMLLPNYPPIQVI